MPSSPNPARTHILFVCVGNSCRSQMAEAFANHWGRGRIRAWSAGSSPLGRIVPPTYDVMAEKGLSLDGQWSKGLHDVPLDDMDVIVSMGCEVYCPVPPGFKGRVAEWDIPDPYGGKLESYREVRDGIEKQIRELLEELDSQSQPGARPARAPQTRVSSKDPRPGRS
jgi:arsenate reductase (thioredoxin)